MLRKLCRRARLVLACLREFGPSFFTLPKLLERSNFASTGWGFSSRLRQNRPFSGEATMFTDITKSLWLYDRPGGVYAIASVVDDFIDRIAIGSSFECELDGRRRPSPRRQSGLQVSGDRDGQFSHRRTADTGRFMRDQHGPEYSLTANGAFCKDFQDTLDKFKVPATEQQELFAIVQSTKADIASVAG